MKFVLLFVVVLILICLWRMASLGERAAFVRSLKWLAPAIAGALIAIFLAVFVTLNLNIRIL